MQNPGMGNIRSYSFKIRVPCSYVIPFIYFSINPREKVYLVTPWINVDVLLPQIHLVMGSIEINHRLNLIEFIKIMRKYKGIETILILKNRDEFSNRWSYSRLVGEGFKVHTDSKIHIKAVLSSKWIYTGSANITAHGLYENKENCEIGRATESPKEHLKAWGIQI